MDLIYNLNLQLHKTFNIFLATKKKERKPHYTNTVKIIVAFSMTH